MGSGKSCAAIVAAEAIGSSTVFVLLPASLKPNFENEMQKCGELIRQKRIVWVATNGISPKRISRLAIKGTPLEGACIIIDEVHNFISQVVNGGRRGTALYDAIYNSKNTKIIALSGTPIINTPFEIGMLLNLINGPIRSTVFKYSGEDIEPKLRSAVEKIRSNEWVDMTEVRGKAVRTWFTPFPFHRDIRGPSKGVLVLEDPVRTTEQVVIRNIWEGTGAQSVDTENQGLYPNNEENFNALFVSKDTLKL